jgi:Tol biopolymer transport system component
VVLAVPLGLVVQACSGSGDAPTHAPTHGTIAFVAGSQVTAIAKVVLMRPDGSEQRTVATGENFGGASWSPNGAKLAFGMQKRPWNRIYIVNADGSGLRGVSSRMYEDAHGPAWSPNGKKLLFEGDDDGVRSIYVIHVDGSDERRLAGGPVSGGDPGIYGGNAWSPDGRKIAFTDRYGRVAVINPDGSGRRWLTRRASVVWSGASWSPDGRELAFAGYEAIWVVRANGTGLRRLVSATAAGLDVGSTGGLGLPVWSPDGRKLGFDTRKGFVYVINRDGSGLRSVGHMAFGLAFAPSWSPDGRWLAITSDRDGNGDIYIEKADGSGERRLTHSKVGRMASGPSWSPDGRWLAFTSDWAFTSDRDPNGDIYIVKADGSGERRLTHSKQDEGFLGWSSAE